MSLNISFSGKACLVVAKDDFLSGLIVTSLHQIGFADVQTAGDIADAVQLVSSTVYDVIICAGKTTDESLHMVRCIRMETPEGAAVGAMIGITGQMDVGDLAAMRNSGANSIVTLPINTRSMLKNVNRALGDHREMISNTTYRGPCRRKPVPHTYNGALRRDTDQALPSPSLSASSPPAGTAPLSPGVSPRGVRGSPKAVLENDESLDSQASIIFIGVNEIAARIEHLKRALHAADDEQTRGEVRAKIMEAAERLVNLIELVDLEENSGRPQNEAVRQNIKKVTTLFTDILRQMSNSRLDAIVTDMERFLYGGEIVLGGSDLLLERLASVEEIVAVLGGRKTNESMKRKLDFAWEGIGKLQQMEADQFSLVDLERNKRARRGVRPVEDGGAASQNGVADLLRSRGNGGGTT
ncbi:response regulator [Magnetospirillum moscoviense]|uniref:Response regulatory domain-containing protein n=1 Tax=Magnetospirillum moscoviense TaxID=1437059 RepID=A0A178MZB4_9PROT|nr:response regulator [Magnetospirillum moscoviense]OAN66021.1 hypothetical protein A6A05_18665 [Magnetospirillum moscoviense]